MIYIYIYVIYRINLLKGVVKPFLKELRPRLGARLASSGDATSATDLARTALLETAAAFTTGLTAKD